MADFLVKCLLIVGLAIAGSVAEDVDVALSELMRPFATRVPRPHDPPRSDLLAFQFLGHAPLCITGPAAAPVGKAVAQACSGECFTMSASARLHTRVPGVMMSLSVGPQSRFEVIFRRNTEIRVRYTGPGGFDYQQRFLYQFQLLRWYDIAVTVCPVTLRILVYVNCSRIYSDPVPRPITCLVDSSKVKACIGGSPVTFTGFQGALQNVRVSSGDYPTTCNGTDCDAVRARVEILELQVSTLSAMVKGLSREKSQCELARARCQWKGRSVEHGYSWGENCSLCTCRNTSVECQQQSCAGVSCGAQQVMVQPNLAEGRCCATCRAVRAEEMHNSCQLGDKYYFHGADMPSLPGDVYKCSVCSCRNRRRLCAQRSCPAPRCSEQEQYRPRGTCCKTCVNHNVCRNRQPCGDPKYNQCYNLPNRGYECAQHCLNFGVRNLRTGRCEPPSSNPFDIFNFN